MTENMKRSLVSQALRKIGLPEYLDRYLAAILASIPIAIIIVALLFYGKQFSGGISNEQSVWGYFGSYFGGVLSPILSFFSFIAALYLLYRSSRTDKIDKVYEFMKDYKSEQMSRDLKYLWDFYEYGSIGSKGHRYPEAERAQRLKENYPLEQDDMTPVYFARRNASYFYLYLAIFMKRNRLERSIIKDLWPAESLETLRDIIIPCEESITKSAAVSDKLVHFKYLLNEAASSQGTT